MKKLITILALLLTCNIMSAQRSDVTETDFFQFGNNIYGRDYTNYETEYLKHKYELKAENILTIGLSTSLLLAAAIVTPTVMYEWNQWIVIPCGTVVIGSTIIGFVFWSLNIQKKAEQIKVVKVCEYNINDNYCISVCNHYDAITQRSISGLRLNITF